VRACIAGGLNQIRLHVRGVGNDTRRIGSVPAAFDGGQHIDAFSVQIDQTRSIRLSAQTLLKLFK